MDCARSSLVEVGLTSDPEMRKGEKAELLKQEETPDEQKEQTDYCSGVIIIYLHSVSESIWELALVPSHSPLHPIPAESGPTPLDVSLQLQHDFMSAWVEVAS